MRLHYLPGTAAMAPHATLAEIGVPYELVRVERDADGRPSGAYLALNPWGKIPTLEDGDLVLTESAAICLHLADKYPDARLAPPVGSPERPELYRWLLWLSNTVQMTQMRHFYPHRYGTEGVKELADAELHEHHARIDAHLAGRDWFVGDERSVADEPLAAGEVRVEPVVVAVQLRVRRFLDTLALGVESGASGRAGPCSSVHSNQR